MVLNFRGSFNPQNFLTVDGYNKDERLEHSQCLVYYPVSGKPGIIGCNAVAVKSSRQSDFYFRRCGHACMLIHRSSPHKCFYSCVKFSQLFITVKLF